MSSSSAESIRNFLDVRRREIAEAHRGGATGLASCTALAAMLDQAVQTAFNVIPEAVRSSVAVLALGGYGRGEIFPKSDVDLMVLCSPGAGRDEAEDGARALLHLLWDAGLDVGHSVRTTDEAMGLYGKALDSWTSMLESRLLIGSRPLADEFSLRLRERAGKEHAGWFIEGVLADKEGRQDRYGSSVKLLEPNVKKSAGGLRDLHAVFWLHRALDPAYAFPIAPGGSAIRTFLDLLRQNGVLDEDEHAAATGALEFLFRVRHEMHYRRESSPDILEYTLQVQVAESLGYGTKAELRSVEVFMRDYYLHARTVHRLSRRLEQRFREIIEPQHYSVDQGVRADGVLIVTDDVVSVDRTVRKFPDPQTMFQAFVLSAERDLDLDFRIRGALERSADLLTEEHCDSPELAAMFKRILRSRRVAATLREMYEPNILGQYLPEFGRLAAFFQHNIYHYFTADEHTLIALENAEQLREEQGFLHDVFKSLPRKDLLFAAVLLHDIGKPVGVADHEISGAGIAETVLTRLGMDEIIPEVSFLVRHHLVMEQIAFRRNIHDPETIKEFAQKFPRPELLDYLYVLTYADLSAVNKSVWTEWKSAMLRDLYQLTAEVLRRNLRGDQIDEFQRSKQEAAAQSVVEALSDAIPRDRIERHLKGMQNDSYLSLFTEEEIGEHITTSSALETVSTSFRHGQGYTEVTVVAQDAPFALSRFCAVLSANDANIFDANIFTRDDGIIIDRFRVVDAGTKRAMDQRACAKIAEDLKHVLQGKLDIEQLFHEHRRKWKRRPKPPANPNIRTGVEFEDNPKFTIIDVYAPDSAGFLYRITEAISKLGLDIYFAKIATRVDGIVDAFYTLDRSGRPVSEPERQEAIRLEILETVKALSEQELA